MHQKRAAGVEIKIQLPCQTLNMRQGGVVALLQRTQICPRATTITSRNNGRVAAKRNVRVRARVRGCVCAHSSATICQTWRSCQKSMAFH